MAAEDNKAYGLLCSTGPLGHLCYTPLQFLLIHENFSFLVSVDHIHEGLMGTGQQEQLIGLLVAQI